VLVRISDHIAPSAAMRVRIVASDLGAVSIVEAGIDDFAVVSGPVGVDGRPAPARPLRLAVSPNPARGAARLALDLEAAAAVEVTVHDPAGRLVRRLLAGPLPAGPSAIAWDGRDARGRPAASGLYFARVAAGGGLERTCRFVLLH
jgi:hypothetical protein